MVEWLFLNEKHQNNNKNETKWKKEQRAREKTSRAKNSFNLDFAVVKHFISAFVFILHTLTHRQFNDNKWKEQRKNGKQLYYNAWIRTYVRTSGNAHNIYSQNSLIHNSSYTKL